MGARACTTIVMNLLKSCIIHISQLIIYIISINTLGGTVLTMAATGKLDMPPRHLHIKTMENQVRRTETPTNRVAAVSVWLCFTVMGT